MRLKHAMRNAARTARVGVAFGAAGDLTHLARLYGGTDKLSHGYLPWYQRHLGHMTLRKLLVFEIGVGAEPHQPYSSPAPGGSLRMWRDYFCRSRIVGIDIEEKLVQLGRRVQFRRADQSDPQQIHAIVKELGVPDIVIDDGSHIGPHVRASFDALFPLLRRGGWYVIEDLATSYSPEYGGQRPAPDATAVGLLRELASDVQARDPFFGRHPKFLNLLPDSPFGAAEMHVYPGIAFIRR